MTATAPAHRAAPHMTHTPDPDTSLQSQAAGSAVEAGTARPRLRDQIAENPLVSLFAGLIVGLLTFLGTVVVALLVFALTSFNDRFDSINDRFDSLEGRMDRLEDRMDRLEDKVDAGFAAQGAQIAELDRKLTALIAHLNATEAVDAALEHRLLIPGEATAEPGDEPPG